MSSDFFAVAAAGIVMTLIAVTVREIKKEYAVVLSLTAAVLMMTWGVLRLDSIAQKVFELMELSNMDSKNSEVLLKALGISFCSKLGRDVCSDAGETAIASKIDFCGKVCMLILSLPIFEEIILLVREIVLS